MSVREKLARVGIRAILKDPARRRELGVRFIMACQELEGRDANRAEAARAYDAVIAGHGESEKPTATGVPSYVDDCDDCDDPFCVTEYPHKTADHADDEHRHQQGL